MASRVLTNNDYSVGWICSLEIELAAAEAMLDENHPDIPITDKDSNTYILGRIGKHNVVLACPTVGSFGTNTTATVAANLLRSFPEIRIGLMVGIGGGAPSKPDPNPRKDLHLGIIVVSDPEDEYGQPDLLTQT